MTTDQLKRLLRPIFVGAAVVLLSLIAFSGTRVTAEACCDGPLPGFTWPLNPPTEVTRPFDKPPGPYAAGHRGVDLLTEPGAPVLAAAHGVVAFAGRVIDRGVVSIRHPGGLRTTYEPVSASVAVGDRVGAGEVIGEVVAGHRGCPGPACLHWGLRKDTEYLDPLLALTPLRVRLLPL